MSNSTLAISRPTLADRVITRSVVSDIILVVTGAAFTGILAQISVPLWPVPITGQTLAVLLVGSTLGMVRGALSMLAYALLGVIGVPWFSDANSGWGVIAGPTGGYIIGFIVAAALTGWLAQRSWDHKVVGAFVSFMAGTVVVFAIGMPWLAAVLNLDLAKTLEYGLYPFIIGGIIKALIAAGLIPLAWRFADRNAQK
jgi:biotin transport system substrate-specific component